MTEVVLPYGRPDPDRLVDVERELRSRYERDHRVCCLHSADYALATLGELAAAGVFYGAAASEAPLVSGEEGSVKRVASAVGEGSIAIRYVHQLLAS